MNPTYLANKKVHLTNDPNKLTQQLHPTNGIKLYIFFKCTHKLNTTNSPNKYDQKSYPSNATNKSVITNESNKCKYELSPANSPKMTQYKCTQQIHQTNAHNKFHHKIHPTNKPKNAPIKHT